jgi:hypothetical protein
MVRATTRDERARVYIEHTDAYGVVFYANYFAFASNAAEALGRVAAGGGGGRRRRRRERRRFRFRARVSMREDRAL